MKSTDDGHPLMQAWNTCSGAETESADLKRAACRAYAPEKYPLGNEVHKQHGTPEKSFEWE